MVGRRIVDDRNVVGLLFGLGQIRAKQAPIQHLWNHEQKIDGYDAFSKGTTLGILSLIQPHDSSRRCLGHAAVIRPVIRVFGATPNIDPVRSSQVRENLFN